MPRIRPVLALTLTLCSCTAPALKDFLAHNTEGSSTGSGSSSTGNGSETGDDTSAGTSAMTSSSGSDTGSSTTSSGGETTSTTTAVSSSSSDASSGSTGPASVCGDGVVAGDEECDDANDEDADRCAVDCTKNRWVFATAATDHSGDLGGIAQADSYCKQYALQTGKADDSWKSFIAWVSDSENDVRDRLYPGKGRYVRTDGEVVVSSVEQFFSGQLDAPINVDQNGDPAPGGVITGTMPDGTRAPGTHCEDWTSNEFADVSEHQGSTGKADLAWTMDQDPGFNPTTCLTKARLYCMEGE